MDCKRRQSLNGSRIKKAGTVDRDEAGSMDLVFAVASRSPFVYFTPQLSGAIKKTSVPHSFITVSVRTLPSCCSALIQADPRHLIKVTTSAVRAAPQNSCRTILASKEQHGERLALNQQLIRAYFHLPHRRAGGSILGTHGCRRRLVEASEGYNDQWNARDDQ